MSGERLNHLHLPDLSISNFRGIKRLSIRRLGRVTLLGGRNGAGKTTVLEAVRVHAARGRPSVLRELLGKREEFVAAVDEDNDPVVSPDYGALFHGWAATREQPITIGPKSGTEGLRIEVSTPSDWSAGQKELLADLATEADVQAVKVVYHDHERLLPWLPATGDLHRQPAQTPLRESAVRRKGVACHRMQVSGTRIAGQQPTGALLGSSGANAGRRPLTTGPPPDGCAH